MKAHLLLGAVLLAGLGSLHAFQEPERPKFHVKIQDDKTDVVDVEGSGAINPTRGINFQALGRFQININTLQNQPLHLSHSPSFLINGRLMKRVIGRFEKVNVPLPKTPGGKARSGSMTVWLTDDLRITQTLELIPSKARKPGGKRLMDTVLVAYNVENKAAKSQTVALRTYMDTYVIDNDGCLFAAPTMPGQILDGMVLEGKTLPRYLQMLQRPDLKNPGFVSHLTLDLGSRFEKADKLVVTQHGAGIGGWDMPAMASMGDSAVGFFWSAKELKPGGKRDMAYAYGEGVAVPLESEGRFQISLGGSFEPGKIFTVSALVADPAVGQSLVLDLPPGMQLVEGKDIQPVAPLADLQEHTSVLWKGRVLNTGDHMIRIRSSTGVTQSKIISVSQ